MIEFKTGDILAEDAEALVNTVNCVGVMGRGIALQFKNAFPENFTAYAAACRRREVRPGRMFVFETRQLAAPRYVINFPTKRHWRNRSRMDDIHAGLRALRTVIRDKGIRSVAVPPLGSGLGGLRWRDVRARIEAELRALGDDVRVIVFEPHSASEPLPGTTPARRPQMTPGRAALVGLMSRYLRGLLDPFLTLLEVHKLMYFMKASGEPALERLRVVKAPYGPYAENLSHVLRDIEGHLIEGYGDGGDAPHRTLKLKPGAEAKAEKSLGRHPETRDRFDHVAQLVDGFESPFGLELLSTVHWVMTNESPRDLAEVESKTYEWHPRKKRFTSRQIALAVDVLATRGWIDSENFAPRG